MKPRILTGTATGAVVALLAVVYKFPPAEYGFYPRCMFHAATHWLCPGCGSTRALHALLHFDVRSALHYNALFSVLAPIAFLWMAFSCYRVMRYDQFPRLVIPRALMACLVVSVLLFTVARNTLFAF